MSKGNDLIKPDAEFEAACGLARKAIYEDGRGMIGANRNYLVYRVARAILAERRQHAATIASLSEALAEAEKKGAEALRHIQEHFPGAAAEFEAVYERTAPPRDLSQGSQP